ncbi:MAG: response regulator [Bacteroidota bacterium]
MKRIDSIFIVDDDPITVFGIRKMLDFVVECRDISSYKNGKLALDQIHQRLEANEQVPDVIFLDINMPIMDGWQFLEEFIRLPIHKKIRINIITSSIDDLDQKNWMRYKSMTEHPISFNNKPLKKHEIAEITKAA